MRSVKLPAAGALRLSRRFSFRCPAPGAALSRSWHRPRAPGRSVHAWLTRLCPGVTVPPCQSRVATAARPLPFRRRRAEPRAPVSRPGPPASPTGLISTTSRVVLNLEVVTGWLLDRWCVTPVRCPRAAWRKPSSPKDHGRPFWLSQVRPAAGS